MQKDDLIFVAGHNGLVGSAIVRRLRVQGYTNLILRSRAELDLCNPTAVESFFCDYRPQWVFLAAAKVGGILANSTSPVEFLRDNLNIQNNVIDAAHRHGVKKLLFLGSSCIYPKLAPQPIREESLLTGELEPTNQWYAIAKIAGIKMMQAYHQQFGFNAISLMPTNLYGPGDNFDLRTSHVLPALIRKFHDAKSAGERKVVIWGSGTPRREFLYVDDLADAAVLLMLHYHQPEIVNVGCGQDWTILELAQMVADITGFTGELVFDTSKPDGTPRKVLDISRVKALGWRPNIGLREGIELTYRWYCENLRNAPRFRAKMGTTMSPASVEAAARGRAAT
ncbi:MAG TPA: GDP-L-fucose synthase [Bryobacteraceae bacterium]|nr:GDP-L-fucose synthase [Bryobacteraceae bacterium]